MSVFILRPQPLTLKNNSRYPVGRGVNGWVDACQGLNISWGRITASAVPLFITSLLMINANDCEQCKKNVHRAGLFFWLRYSVERKCVVEPGTNPHWVSSGYQTVWSRPPLSDWFIRLVWLHHRSLHWASYQSGVSVCWAVNISIQRTVRENRAGSKGQGCWSCSARFVDVKWYLRATQTRGSVIDGGSKSLDSQTKQNWHFYLSRDCNTDTKMEQGCTSPSGSQTWIFCVWNILHVIQPQISILQWGLLCLSRWPWPVLVQIRKE